MDMIQKLADELKLKREQVEKTVALIDEGNTIPFIARYRKEETGSLDDNILRELEDRLTYLRNTRIQELTEHGGHRSGIRSSRVEGKNADALATELLDPYFFRIKSYESAGNLRLAMQADGDVSDYRRELSERF